LEKIGGGNIVVCDGKVIRSLPLELFGLESSKDIKNVVQMRKEIEFAMKELGCNLPSPFETLSFVALPVTIGNLKICQEGLVDVWKNEHVDVVVE
jgi:adenine deaminase